MIYQLPKGPGLEMVSHRFSPLVHPDNGFGQTRPPVFSSPRRSLSGAGPVYGWQRVVNASGLAGAYINDNPSLAGFFDDLLNTATNTASTVGTKAVDTLGQYGIQQFSNIFSSSPSAPPAPAPAPGAVIVTGAPASSGFPSEILGIPTKWFGMGALAVLATTVYSKLK